MERELRDYFRWENPLQRVPTIWRADQVDEEDLTHIDGVWILFYADQPYLDEFTALPIGFPSYDAAVRFLDANPTYEAAAATRLRELTGAAE